MTVIAVMTAGLFPAIHLGRCWFFYWLMPYPESTALWINFRSPLVWDVFAVSTYLAVSAIFFYVGMIPDLASRGNAVDRLPDRPPYRSCSPSVGGLGKQWYALRSGFTFLPLWRLATPLVISVHSVVSWDFAMSVFPAGTRRFSRRTSWRGRSFGLRHGHDTGHPDAQDHAAGKVHHGGPL